MVSAERRDSLETWRLVIIGDNGAKTLITCDQAEYTLPQVQIPARQRIAENINRVVKLEFGLRIISLDEIVLPDPGLTGHALYHAAVSIEPDQTPRGGTDWVFTRSLAATLSRGGDFAAVEAFLSKLEIPGGHGATQPFLKLDWFTKTRKWIERRLRPHSLHLTGQFRQLNASSTFSLIRFETNRTAVWFKAVGEPNVRECAVTLTLAGMCPDYLPSILAIKRTWNAWLSLQATGESLASNADIDRWKTAASSLANLQIGAMSGLEKLLKAGAHDLRTPRLLTLIEPFFEFAKDSTGRSPLQSSGNLTLLELSDLKEVVRAVLDELSSFHLTDTVGLMDLNPGNIFCTADHAIFLDWAEGFVGSPLFSFEYLVQHFRRTVAREPSTEEQFRNAYLEQWREHVPPNELRRIVALSPLAALFGYASTVWSTGQTSPAWTARWERYLLQLVRKMKNAAPKAVLQGVRP
jgi:hypothetical protein